MTVNYLGQTFAYLKKHFLLPVIVMSVPAIAACFLSTPYWEVAFVTAFDYMPYRSASETFRIMFGDSWTFVWPVVIIALLQILGAALVMSAMDRHFRTGRMSLRDPWRLVNNVMFPIAIGVAVMSVLSIVWRFLVFGLVMLVQVSSQAMGLPSGVALAVICAVAACMFVLHVMIITPMLFWAPVMFIYGYKFRDAAASSFKLIAGKKLFRRLFLPLLFCAGIQLLIGFLGVHPAISHIVGFFVFLFTNVLITVFTMIAFYDISGLDRRDLKPYHNIPLPKLPQAESNVGGPARSADKASAPTQSDDEKPSQSPRQKQSSKQKSAQKPTKSSSKPARTQQKGESGAKKASAKKKEPEVNDVV